MKKIKDFLKTSLLGGLVVMLPVTILLSLFAWVFNSVSNLIQPLTNLVIEKSHLQEFLANLLVLAVILILCFVLGVLVKTRLGKFLHETLEKILKIIPFYSLVRETIKQLIGREKPLFRYVVMVRFLVNKQLGFVADDEDPNHISVFVPTSPNPTSGWVIFCRKDEIQRVDISIEDAMRLIFSCGVGSSKFINENSMPPA